MIPRFQAATKLNAFWAGAREDDWLLRASVSAVPMERFGYGSSLKTLHRRMDHDVWHAFAAEARGRRTETQRARSFV